jgi:hypothetical protein
MRALLPIKAVDPLIDVEDEIFTLLHENEEIFEWLHEQDEEGNRINTPQDARRAVSLLKSGGGDGAAIDVALDVDMSRICFLALSPRGKCARGRERASLSNHREEKFMLTRSERAKIAEEFPEHAMRMRSCLLNVGRAASDSDLILAWARYSDSLCASWLMPPESDTVLTEILLAYLPAPPTEKLFHKP